MKARALVFLRQSGAPMPGNKLVHFGHVGWGFQVGPGEYCFGATENLSGALAIQGPDDNGFWSKRGDAHAMLREMGSNLGHMPYDDYKVFVVSNCQPNRALKESEATRLAGYGGLGNNCLDHVYRVIVAYGGKDSMEWPSTNWIPTDWFHKLPGTAHPMAGPHPMRAESAEDDGDFLESLEAPAFPFKLRGGTADKESVRAFAGESEHPGEVGEAEPATSGGKGNQGVEASSGGSSPGSAAPLKSKQTVEGTLPPGRTRYYRLTLEPEQELVFTIYTSLIGDVSFASATVAMLDSENGVLARSSIAVDSVGEDFTRTSWDFTAEDEGEHIFRIRNEESGKDAASVRYKIKLK